MCGRALATDIDMQLARSKLSGLALATDPEMQLSARALVRGIGVHSQPSEDSEARDNSAISPKLWKQLCGTSRAEFYTYALITHSRSQ